MPKPIADNVWILCDEDKEKSEGGIVIPQMVPKEFEIKPSDISRGLVLEIGSEWKTKDGFPVSPRTQKGRPVLFRAFSGQFVERGGKKYALVPEEQILAYDD